MIRMIISCFLSARKTRWQFVYLNANCTNSFDFDIVLPGFRVSIWPFVDFHSCVFEHRIQSRGASAPQVMNDYWSCRTPISLPLAKSTSYHLSACDCKTDQEYFQKGGPLAVIPEVRRGTMHRYLLPHNPKPHFWKHKVRPPGLAPSGIAHFYRC